MNSYTSITLPNCCVPIAEETENHFKDSMMMIEWDTPLKRDDLHLPSIAPTPIDPSKPINIVDDPSTLTTNIIGELRHDFVNIFSKDKERTSSSCNNDEAKVPISPKSRFGSFFDQSYLHKLGNFEKDPLRQDNLCNYNDRVWLQRLHELSSFRDKHGHCLVRYVWNGNYKLSQWVKRQRYQYKLLKAGKHSSLTPTRIQRLDDIGFSWSSHEVAWELKFEELKEFTKENGHSNVPTMYTPNRSLASWVKSQRRQYKMYRQRVDSSHPTSAVIEGRIKKLKEIGFDFDPRNTGPSL